MFKRSVLAAAILATVAFPAGAQDIATRIANIEEQIRQLTGQIEELNFSIRQLQGQPLGQRKLEGDEGQLAPQQPMLKKLAETSSDDSGIEVIEEGPAIKKPQKQAIVLDSTSSENLGDNIAPAPQTLGSGGNAAAQPDDGGFQGQVLVPLGDGNQDQGQSQASAQPAVIGGEDGNGIEQVSLSPATETPESLYKNSNEALLRRQFPDAEAGFRNFLAKYPEHSLAGSAQYWLGETFYVQGDVRQAAQNFLEAYKRYPKSRRAPDSLLKLGMSLGKLGQKEQGCAALGSVSDEFPRAVEVKKRAVAEFKRAGC